MSNIENIDSYLDGSMSQSDRVQFEQALDSDPGLKREFDFQKNLVDGIKEARRLELKTRLNSIDVSGLSASSGLSAGTITAGVVITAGLIIGGYYLFKDTPAEEVTDNVVTEQVIDEPVSEEPLAITDDTTEEESPVETQEAEPIQEAETSEAVATQPEEDENIIDDLVKPGVPVGEEATEEEIVADIDVPDPELDTNIATKSNSIEIEMRSKRKYDFHYAFESNKLILYGDFSDEPYELIELKNDAGINLFLYYKAKYYGLDKNESEIVPLEEVTSDQIKIKLDQQRNK